MATIAEDDALLRQWQDLLEGNGDVSQATRDHIVLAMIGEIYKRVRATELLLKYIPWLEAIKWASIAVGLSVVALLWGVFTHAIQIVVK